MRWTLPPRVASPSSHSPQTPSLSGPVPPTAHSAAAPGRPGRRERFRAEYRGLFPVSPAGALLAAISVLLAWPPALAVRPYAVVVDVAPSPLAISTTYVAHPSDQFWSATFTDVGLASSGLRHVGSFLNTTPIAGIRFGGGGATYDPTTGTYWTLPGGGGAAVPTQNAIWNLTWLKAWCASRSQGCDWLSFLPAQQNDSALAVHYARWFHQVLGFAPTLWQLGNEPESWTHYGENVSTWRSTDANHTTPTGYANMSASYIAAVRAIFPGDRFVGVESDSGNASFARAFAKATAATSGPVVQAMAFHQYPHKTGDTSSLATFYGTLNATNGIPSAFALYQGSVLSGCPSCTALPIRLDEYWSGPVPFGSNPLAVGLPMMIYLAGSAVLALQSPLSAFGIFDDNGLVNSTTGVPTAAGTLYSTFFANLTLGNAHACGFLGQPRGLYCVDLQNGSRRSLLVVNTNLTIAATFGAGAFPSGISGREWAWGNYSSTPYTTAFDSLPASWTVPTQGVLLVDNFGGNQSTGGSGGGFAPPGGGGTLPIGFVDLTAAAPNLWIGFGLAVVVALAVTPIVIGRRRPT